MEENNETTSIAPVFMDANALIESVEESSTEDRSAQLSEGFNDILRLKKYGEKFDLSPWMYGSEQNEVHPESVWVIDPNTFKHGFLGWLGDGKGGQVPGQLPDELWAPWNKKWPEKPDDMPHVKDAYAFCAVCISSPVPEQVGAYVSLSDNKKLGLDSYAKIEQALRQRVGLLKSQPDLIHEMYPVVQFDHEEIYLKKRGSTFNKPIVRQTGWTSHEKVKVISAPEAAASGAVEENDEPSPRASRRR